MTPTHEMTKAFRQRRDLVLELLQAIDGFQVNHPEGAFYVFPNISAVYGKSVNGKKITNSSEFCEYILHEAHVAIVAGEAFGADDCVRVAYSTSEEQLREAMQRIRTAVERLE
jgi:aspartate aminotransferase